MKQPSLVPTLLALTLAVGSSMVLAPACGNVATPGTGGTGGSTTSTTTSTSSSGGSTSTGTSSLDCKTLCDHLAEIDCNVLSDCTNDCQNHLNAPSGCEDEADALLQCWIDHIDDFMCTMKTILPPPACKDEETAFNMCVNGGGAPDASCICSAGVGVGDDTSNCSRKTTCATVEFVQTCQKLTDGEPWTCSCFANGGLLGTCPEEPEFEHCSNQYGCCVPLFCAASGE
jgi:hypothetical protein